MQALINEGNALQAKTELTDEDRARIGSIRSEISATKTDIDAEKALSADIAEANQFLNGNGVVRSVATQAVVDPQQAFIADKANTVRGFSKFFAMDKSLSQAEANKQAHRFGMFLMATLGKKPAAIKYCTQNGIPLAGMTEGVNEDGGALVPMEFENTLILLREKYGIFRSRSSVRPMSREQLTVFRQTGGLTAYFIDEEDAITASKAAFDRVQLNAKKLGALAYLSSELDADSALDLGDHLMGEMAYAFAKKEDQCGFIGDGTSTYGGMVGVTQKLIDVFTVSGGTGLILGSGNAWSELTLGDFHKVKGALPEFAEEGNPAWFCSKTFYATVMEKLMLASGGVTAAEIAAGAPRRFLGYDVVVTQAMASSEANSQVPAVLGDLSMGTTFGDRRQTSVAWSEHYAFANDQLAVRGTQRFDINCHDVGETGVAGPVVGILTAAS